MACNPILPGCSTPDSSDIVPEPITQFGTILGVLSTILGILGILKAIEVVGGVLTIFG